MTAHTPRLGSRTDNDIDQAGIPTILVLLDARAATDRLSAVAARIIRGQEMAISTLDNEVVEAEWRAIAHAVELDRITDYRRQWEQRRILKGGAK